MLDLIKEVDGKEQRKKQLNQLSMKSGFGSEMSGFGRDSEVSGFYRDSEMTGRGSEVSGFGRESGSENNYRKSLTLIIGR